MFRNCKVTQCMSATAINNPTFPPGVGISDIHWDGKPRNNKLFCSNSRNYLSAFTSKHIRRDLYVRKKEMQDPKRDPSADRR